MALGFHYFDDKALRVYIWIEQVGDDQPKGEDSVIKKQWRQYVAGLPADAQQERHNPQSSTSKGFR